MRWLISKPFRRARELQKQVRKHVSAQRDILSDERLRTINEASEELKNRVASQASDEELTKSCSHLEHVANQNLRPYPHASIRENIEVLLVAVAVAMAVRTFFLQPFKIPTGSMQPSLYGITTDNLNESEEEIPGLFGRFIDRFVYGISYYHLVAESEGRVTANPPKTIIPFLLRKQTIMIDGARHTLWNPPKNITDQRGNDIYLFRAGVNPNRIYREGEDVIKFKVTRGDYLFVDRLSYNFRRPDRGEIIVFKTEGIDALERRNQGELFYIKRLVALSGEEVRISDDRHLIIDGVPLNENTPHFEDIYSFDPDEPPQDSKFSGHVNLKTARQHGFQSDLPVFPDENAVHTVAEDHYMAMGDNTMSSFDSRGWGDLPRENVMGKYAFVFWPFTDRAFGGIR